MGISTKDILKKKTTDGSMISGGHLVAKALKLRGMSILFLPYVAGLLL